MTWLLPSSLSSLATEDLNSDSTPPSDTLELWATSSGKPTLRPSSWHGWKNRPWSQLLFGAATSTTWTPPHFAEWIGSPGGSRASRSAPQESGKDRPTSDGSGSPVSSHSFGKFSPDGAYLRTSLDLFGSDLDPSSETWPSSGSMSSGVCSRRPTWEPATSVSASSSSPAWMTPDVVKATDRQYTRDGGEKGKERLTLAGQSGTWPTPDANCWKGGVGGSVRMRGGELREAPHREGSLSDASSLPAPLISTCGPECSPKHRRLNPHFVEWLMGLPDGWSIARIGSVRSEMASYLSRLRWLSECLLNGQGGISVGETWPTPTANDDNKSPEAHLAMKKRMGERDGSGANRTAITSLQVRVKVWPNPEEAA